MARRDTPGWGLNRPAAPECACCTDPDAETICPWCDAHCRFDFPSGRMLHAVGDLERTLDECFALIEKIEGPKP